MPSSLTTDLMGFLTISGLVPLTCNYSQSESVFLFCFFAARLFPNHPLHVFGPLCDSSQCQFPSECLQLCPVVTVKRLLQTVYFQFAFVLKIGPLSTFFKSYYSFIWSFFFFFFFLYDSSHFGLLGTGGKHLNSFQYNFDLLNLSVSVLLKTFTTFQREILYCYTFI